MALDFFAGCLGGCAGIVVGYPFDTIKVHIQTQDHRNPKYKGTWHCFRTLLARESMTGLYRGMTSPMAGVAVINAIVFGVYGQTHKMFTDGLPGGSEHHLSGHFLAGASAGIAQAPVCSPIELAKTRLQLQESQGGRTGLSGPVQCLRQIHRAEGMRGVFNGLGITLLREAPSYGVYFVTYEALTRSDRPISTFHMLLAGGLAGTASWVISYPLDVVKSRLQADSTAKYAGALDCFRKSVSSEGYSCLFRGLNSTIIRAFPTNAATFTVVTWTMRLLGAEQEYESVTPTREKSTTPTRESSSHASRSWNTLDRYGETSCPSLEILGDAIGGYSSQLATLNLISRKTIPKETSQPAVSSRLVSQHFDEVRHFEWTGEMIHC